ncbi:hypothetical protein ACQPX6_09820 [Actinomycetospora sp. CA-101289]|uniref:hypothetical protein n=1 Tax=Actinomycetospora sp. CA-101289 TaxID=3239893 RepID=UPI003D952FDC
MTGAPDLAIPVVGWRLWLLDADDDGPALTAPRAMTPWPARVATTAACRAGCGRPPSWGCRCGLYATAQLDHLLTDVVTAGAVLGATALWGRVVEATEGWRAERGYPLVLFAPTVDRRDRGEVLHVALPRLTPGRDDDQASPATPDEGALRALARRYAIPVHTVPSLPPYHAPTMAGPAATLRDEAARGLAARRLGDGAARLRFDRAVEGLLAVLDQRRSTA